MTIAIGQTIDGTYRIERQLAAGGMGTVYEATHLTLNTRFALKVMDPALAQRPDFQARFLREAQAAAGLSHPNLVKVTHAANAQGLSFLVMELVEHGSLRARMERYRQSSTPVPVGFALDLARQAAEGLDEAHRHGLIHRDIKPENLLLHYARKPSGSTFCTLKIADFGLVQLAASPQHTQAPMATLDYAAPEQLQLAAVDGRCDVFALAVVTYELLSGQRPFGEAQDWGDALLRRQSISPQPPQALRPDLPAEAAALLLRCLAYDPALRPHAGELAVALGGLQQARPMGLKLTVAAPTVAAPPPAGAANLTRVSPQPAQGPLTGLATYHPTQTPSPWPRLRVKLGQAPAQAFDLTTAGLTLGRDPGNSIPLADPDVSRRHLALTWDGAQVHVTDLGASNGTLLGGQRLPPRVATPWPYGTPVQLGACVLQLSPPSLAAAGPPAAGAQAATRRMSRRLQQAQSRGQRLALDVGPGEDSLQLTPGQPAQIALLLFNLDRQIDHVTLSVSGPPAEWLSLPAQPQALAPAGQPGCELELPLTISLPRRPEATAGKGKVTLRATSGVDPSFAATVELTWQVQAFQAGELRLSPKRSRSSAGGAHTLRLRNGGNTPVSYALSGEDDELALEYRFTPARVSLKPGEEQQVSLDLTAKRAAPAERTHQITVLARPEGGGPTLTAQGEFVQETTTAASQPVLAPAPAPAQAHTPSDFASLGGCMLKAFFILLVLGGLGVAIWWLQYEQPRLAAQAERLAENERLDQARSLLYEANSHLERNDYNLAIETYGEVLALDPSNSSAYYGRGISYTRRGIDGKDLDDLRLGIEDYNRAINLYSGDSSYYLERGIAKYYLDGCPAAEDDFTVAIEEFGNNNAHYWLGRCYQFMDMDDEARQEFQVALDNAAGDEWWITDAEGWLDLL